MTDPLEPTVIVPTGHCWAWFGRRPHGPHMFGDVPDVRRCPGIAIDPQPNPEEISHVDDSHT